MATVPLLLVLLVAVYVAVARVKYELLDYNPVAAPTAYVRYGAARFTVLTSRIIRLEYDPKAIFEDRASVAVVNRRFIPPMFQTTQRGNTVVIKTDYLSLSYTPGSVFSPTSLNISLLGFNTSWSYGDDVSQGNLLGTIRTLDELGVTSLNCVENAGISVHDEALHCAWGLVSQSGWSTIDDSSSFMLDDVTGWWSAPNVDAVDLYFLGFGSDFQAALREYSQIGGSVAMPPRASNGIMWSRWFNYNDADVMDVVSDYENRALPLDVFILDMDWHVKNNWGAYSVDRTLFPLVQATMSSLRERGLLTSGNLHDANGIASFEDEYDAFCVAIGANAALNATIAFDICNMTYAYALEDVVLKPLEANGFGDFWWTDWQQGGTQGGCSDDSSFNPTMVLNRLRGTDRIRRSESQRGMHLARWGGLGNHRYQVGFSGDVKDVTWRNLAYQPYFSYTAANVLFSYWSHDLVGPSSDFELYTRWIQWGAYSGVFRTHDRGMASGTCSQDDPPDCAIIKVWDCPTSNFEANRKAMQERHELLPYLYNAQFEAFTAGLTLLRPLYIYWPDQPNAYLGDQLGNFPSYMFGPDILVSPIVNAGYENDTLARQSIWIPPGTWVAELTGSVITGPQMLSDSAFDLSETPRFIRAGAVIPRMPLKIGNTIGRAQQQYTSLEFVLYNTPGVSKGNVTLYEDDGISTDYIRGSFCTTLVTFDSTSGIVVHAPAGKGYAAYPAKRDYTFRYFGAPPQSVSMGGNNLTWTYDGSSMQVVIKTGLVNTQVPLTVSIVPSAVAGSATMWGMKGAMQRARLAKETLDTSWSTPGAQIVQSANLADVAALAYTLSYSAISDQVAFSNIVAGFGYKFAAAVAEVRGLTPGRQFPPNAMVQWWSSARNDSCLCVHSTCNSIQQATGYEFVRIEGFVPSSTSPNVIPLYDYWNPKLTDNWATTQGPAIPAPNYQRATFSNGVVFKTQEPGTTAAVTYWSEARQDWLTVASAEGIAYAKANQYVLGNATIGWVYIEAPAVNRGQRVNRHRAAKDKRDSVTAPTVAQYSRALALLTTFQ